MTDDFLTPDEIEEPDNRNRVIIISIVVIVLLVACCGLLAAAWYLGDSVVAFFGP